MNKSPLWRFRRIGRLEASRLQWQGWDWNSPRSAMRIIEIGIKHRQNLFTPAHKATTPEHINKQPEILLAIVSPPLARCFLKMRAKFVSMKNHKNDPKKTPVTSRGGLIRSLIICPFLTAEKAVAKANSVIGFVRARKNVEKNVFACLWNRLGASCTAARERKM